ncbi:hypothetical protein H4219_001035 [Mycoemilia scoparia]|uniref:Peroxisomal membrane protein PEX16 n=1 Tax=Mycoemilia scoparia TaxID=417184 RepID=A0A9W8A7K1_9FUNG|nr:hypothetical protein H4219_001035 [Mycoemilia scoparia]
MLSKYQQFLLNNAAQISSIEGAIRALTYVLPGRFSDAEIASEGIYTVLSFLSLYHDRILAKAAHAGLLVKNGKEVLVSQETPFNRYQLTFWNSSKTYRCIALILCSSQFTEKLVEMLVKKKWGEKRKWQIVSWIEIIKAACRLVLLKTTRDRMVLGSMYPERIVDPATLDSSSAKTSGNINGFVKPTSWKGKRSGNVFESVETIMSKSERQSGGISGIISFKASPPEAVIPGHRLVRPLKLLGLTGELLYILRPVAYGKTSLLVENAGA